MINLMKADFKKVFYLTSYRYFLLSALLLSILFGAIFLFTINITQGKQITELSGIEVIDITFLGIDVAAIMLILFTAFFISKDLATGAVHLNLAITPHRLKYFLSKICFISILSTLVSVALIASLLSMNWFVISLFGLDTLSLFNNTVFMKIIGSILMVVFYSLLSVTGAFYFQTAAGGITFALGVMFLPTLIKMFPDDISTILLPIFPESSLLMFIDVHSMYNSLLSAVITLILWIIIACILSIWKFKRMDY